MTLNGGAYILNYSRAVLTNCPKEGREKTKSELV